MESYTQAYAFRSIWNLYTYLAYHGHGLDRCDKNLAISFSKDSHAMNKGPDASSSCLICTSAMNWGQKVSSRSPCLSWSVIRGCPVSFAYCSTSIFQSYIVGGVCLGGINLELSLSLEDPADNS